MKVVGGQNLLVCSVFGGYLIGHHTSLEQHSKIFYENNFSVQGFRGTLGVIHAGGYQVINAGETQKGQEKVTKTGGGHIH